jgi:putative phage-type endonuclease
MGEAILVQGTTEWHEARCGRVTASRIADVTARTKTGWGASRKNYAAELIAERLTGIPAQGFTNAAMQWGIDTEPQARAAYEFFRDEAVQEVGLVTHPTIPMSSASPDGLVGEDGMIEIKCPNTATHIDTLLAKSIAGKYVKQMQWQMACAGRQWVDFVSFDPRMPEHLRLFVERVERDDEQISEIEKAVREFLAEIDETIAALRRQAAPVDEPNTILAAL